MNDAMLHKRGLEPNVAGDQGFSKPNTGGPLYTSLPNITVKQLHLNLIDVTRIAT